MPHYLARVAAAATRTTTAALPQVAAPPVMPAGLLPHPVALPGDNEPFLTAPEGEAVGLLPAEPAGRGAETPSLAPLAELAAPPAQGQRQTALIGKSSTEMVQEMPNLEHSSAAAPVVPSKRQRLLEQLLPGPNNAAQVIRAPAALRPAEAVNWPLLRPAQESRQPAEVVDALAPRLSREAGLAAAPRPSPPPSRQGSAAAPPEHAAPVSQEPPRVTNAQTGEAPLRASKPAPIQPARPGAVPQPGQPRAIEQPAGGGRQVKITIGQIDVQVHNRSPLVNVQRRPSASPPATSRLEQPVLERFRLRP